MKRGILVVCVLLSTVGVFGSEIPIRKYDKKIVLSQKDDFIAMPWDISVLEDGGLLLSDLKEQKIMFFSKDGTLIHSWKKNGQGPGEFLAAWVNDYEKPYFAHYDSRQIKLLLYRREAGNEFKWIRDLRGINALTWDLMIYRGRIYYDASLFIDDRLYCIYSSDLNGKDQKHYLPAEVRYGLEEGDDWKKVGPRYQGLWGLPRSYMFLYGDHIYSTWIGGSGIIKIDIENGKWVRFGEKTKFYRKPDVSARALGQGPQSPDALNEYSWITGLFADQGVVGLLANIYDNTKAKWNVLLQTFDEFGKVLKEEILEGINPPSRSLCYTYCRTDGCLYVMNEEDSVDDTDFVIYQYRIGKSGS